MTIFRMSQMGPRRAKQRRSAAEDATSTGTDDERLVVDDARVTTSGFRRTRLAPFASSRHGALTAEHA